ncbi:acid protease [Aureobasidium subglaciale]|nr:acid protease [Aureobasidium subglaciale]
MKFAVATLLCLFSLVSCARAHPFSRTRASARANTVELALMSSVGKDDGFAYYTNITVGTPAQLHTLLVDTGSGISILMASNASFCESHICNHGTFDSSKSSTFEVVEHERLVMNYADFSHFYGDYFTDVVQINDRVISNVPMGRAHDVKLSYSPYTGTLGIGPSPQGHPPGLVDSLRKAGAISSRLYSIYLNTLDQYGSLLFGGVDTDKYKGSLTTLNCVRSPLLGRRHDIVSDFFLYLHEIAILPHDGPKQIIHQSTKDNPYYTLPDTGSSGWQLPASAYNRVIESAGVERAFDRDAGLSYRAFVRPCSDVARGIANTTHFELTLTGNGTNTATLDLELADFFVPVTSEDGSFMTNSVCQAMCELQVYERRDNFLITGNGAMRAGYWVFDLDNGQVSVAQANLQTNSSNVVAVDAGTEGLSKAALNHKAETQHDLVEDGSPASGTYKLSTATNTVGYANGAESYPVVTGVMR